MEVYEGDEVYDDSEVTPAIGEAMINSASGVMRATARILAAMSLERCYGSEVAMRRQ